MFIAQMDLSSRRLTWRCGTARGRTCCYVQMVEVIIRVVKEYSYCCSWYQRLLTLSLLLKGIKRMKPVSIFIIDTVTLPLTWWRSWCSCRRCTCSSPQSRSFDWNPYHSISLDVVELLEVELVAMVIRWSLAWGMWKSILTSGCCIWCSWSRWC